MPEKTKQAEARDDGVDIEAQFVLRMPEEPAKTLREAIQSQDSRLKERFSIRLDFELRFGEVRFDHWLMHAKVVDLPTIIESLKTIDGKSFYKTADICQLMICKDEPDAPAAEEELPNKAKKKDSIKVDKKYFWPHGIGPPCKNVRKRRFRKTLKKKFVEAPEIEKEVKRLLRIDNDAVNVKYEIINEDDDLTKGNYGSMDEAQELDDGGGDMDQKSNVKDEIGSPSSGQKRDHHKNQTSDETFDEMGHTSQTGRIGVGEHDIFGEEVSSSDEDEHVDVMDLEETSRLSADDSRLSDFSMSGTNADKMITEFDKSMFNSQKLHHGEGSMEQTSTAMQSQSGYYDRHDLSDIDFQEPQMSREQINTKIIELRKQCDDYKVQQGQKAQEISSIQNPTLRQRMQETLDNLLSQIVEKEMEIHDLENML